MSVRLELPRLPSFRLVGGNATPGHWAIRHRDMIREQTAWRKLMLEAGCRPSDGVLMPGRVSVRVRLVFPKRRGGRLPDVDNAMKALKPLMDLLEPQRVVRLRGRYAMRGYLGLIADDGLLAWAGVPEYVRGGGPRTVITLWTEGEDEP